MCLGTAISFTTNPANTTTCLGSTATFMCGTDQPTGGLSWLINERNYSLVPGALITSSSSSQSTLTVPENGLPEGAKVRCYHSQSIYSDLAFLIVQGLFV